MRNIKAVKVILTSISFKAWKKKEKPWAGQSRQKNVLWH